MELPNYTRQLTQQLRSLRKEGQFCDCSILVGDTPHQAHKLVLAASSLLFRSLLEGSDTISIDTAVVSSQEFSCLLDMVYTGKLPPGKHNFTRIIAAADSLQMFDVAVGCKNILANLMKQSTTITATTHTTKSASPSPTTTRPASPSPTTTKPASPSPTTTKPASPSPTTTKPASPSPTTTKPASPSPTTTKLASPSPTTTTPSSPSPTTNSPQLKQLSQNAEHTGSLEAAVPNMVEGGVNIGTSGAKGKGEEPSLERGVTTQAATQTKPMKEKKDMAGPPSKRACLQRPGSAADLDTLSAGEAKMPAEVGDLWQFLKGLQTWDRISTEEKQVILSCCDEDPGGPAVFQRLQSRVKEQHGLTAQTLLTLLGLLREFHPNLATLLQEQPEGLSQGATGSEAEELEEEQAQSATGQVGEEEEDTEGEGERKTRSKAKRSPRRFSCLWCNKVFDYKCRMVAHADRCSMSQEATLQCPECAEEMPTPQALQLHRNKEHPEPKTAKKKRAQVSCDICGRTFAHPSGMLYHKRTEHFEQKPFVCEECGDKFGANSSLKNHMRLHTGEKPYRCKNCDMSFSVAAALAYHTKKKHSEGKMYSCQYCEALFAQSIELTRHVRTHTGDKPYVCRECGKGFSQANGLSAHLHTTHNVKEPHDCQKCRLSFPSLEDHRTHIQECHPKEFHQCPECSKLFTNPALLEKHIAVHAGGKPYSCKICQRSYQQMSGLWYHNRTNHPEVFGGQSSRQLKSLLRCNVCSKFFPSASSLAKHQRTEHPDPDPSGVKCAHCPALFPSEADMQEHASTEHFSQEGAAVGCSLCPLVCSSQLQLQEHFLSFHIGVVEEQTSTSQTETEADPAGEAEQVLSVDQSQQVFVALGNGEDGDSSSEVMAVNMEDLLNGTVTFICD
ncbi:zinc finger and BTB domain-containing protein 40 [Esox lucius]|uniref:Zinc finger and BTB domain containing 40 n=1 Tax=Esox lucius TaxID=8010 RepID=A0A3P8XPB3_ESOLU|nr:zinc finger and BTB domain-containing protein 40 [Esox lucius]